MKRQDPPFSYQNLTLKLLVQEDLPHTLSWRNQYCEWFNDSKPLEPTSHTQWFEKYQMKKDDLVFIAYNTDDARVGQAAIYNIDEENKTAEFGRFLVNPAFAGQNYMKLTCQSLLIFSRERLALNSIYLEVKPHNERAIHIYKSCGFVPEKGVNAQGNLVMNFDL